MGQPLEGVRVQRSFRPNGALAGVTVGEDIQLATQVARDKSDVERLAELENVQGKGQQGLRPVSPLSMETRHSYGVVGQEDTSISQEVGEVFQGELDSH